MTRLHLLQRTVCPPDKWRYVHPEDGYVSSCFTYDGWMAKILKHKKDNGYEVPPDWREQAEDQLCKSLPPGWCQYDGGGDPSVFLNRRTAIGDIVRATEVLYEFVKQGHPIVDQKTAEERAQTCARCYAKDSVQGCSPCVGLANLIADVCGAQTTSADEVLENKQCLVCGCSARANVWVPVSVSAAGWTDEMSALAPNWCWKKQEIEALKQKRS